MDTKTSAPTFDSTDVYWLLSIFFCGVLAIAAMMVGYKVNGISGSLVLLLLYLLTLPLWIGLLTPLATVISAVVHMSQNK